MNQLQSHRSVPLDHPALRCKGAVEVEHACGGPEWLRPWRVHRQWVRLIEPTLLTRAYDAAGVRLELASDTATLGVGVDPCPEVRPVEERPEWTFDLYVDGVLHERTLRPREAAELTFTGWPAGSHRFELYCDVRSPVRFTALAVDDGASLDTQPDARPRWLVYGSSITQCGAAAGPGETWPAIVARQLNLNHTNLGYGGNAALDPIIARMIAGLPADFISVCCSVNNYGVHTPRFWRAAVIGFIQTIRDGHPDTPMVCTSPVWSGPRETTPSGTGLTLVAMRQQVRDAVDALRAAGDVNLHYVDGLTIFGPEMAGHMPDQLHPDAEGYRLLAQRYAQHVMPVLGVTA